MQQTDPLAEIVRLQARIEVLTRQRDAWKEAARVYRTMFIATNYIVAPLNSIRTLYEWSINTRADERKLR